MKKKNLELNEGEKMTLDELRIKIDTIDDTLLNISIEEKQFVINYK